MNERHLVIHTDGGARGNPGPAAYGVVIESGGQVIKTMGVFIGSTTNNQAEYQGVHAAMTFAVAHGATSVDLYSDSELIVKQLRGEYRVKNKELGPWFIKVQALANQVGKVRWIAIPRSDNTMADALVNQALDQAAT